MSGRAERGEEEKRAGEKGKVMTQAQSLGASFFHCANLVNIQGNVTAQKDVNIKVVQSDVLDEKARLIMKRTTDRITKWNKNMIKTSAFEKIIQKLNTGSTWITITGSPGEGKTTTAYMALEELHKQGKQVFQLWSPRDYSDVTLSCSFPVILLDDIFGDLNLDQTKLEAWKPVLHQILDERDHRSQQTGAEEDKRVSVILVGREYILKAASRHFGKVSRFFTLKEIDMSHPVFRSDEEKINIWNAVVKSKEIQLKDSEISELFRINSGHGFPHVCRMFADLHKRGDIKSARQFFQAPLRFLNDTITTLMEKESTLNLFKEMIKQNGKITGLELRNIDSSYKMVQNADDLVGTYMRKDGDCYVFDHASIYDSVSYNICKLDPLFVITNCDVFFIHQRLRFYPSSDGQQEDNSSALNLVVHIPESYASHLAKRFATEVSRGNLVNVLSHEACSNKRFVEDMMSEISLNLTDLLVIQDGTTGQPFLQLVPSNKSPELLKYIDGKTDYIRENQSAVDTLLLGVSMFAASDVLLYLTDKHIDKLNINKLYLKDKTLWESKGKTPLMLAAATGDSEFVEHVMALKPQLLAMDESGTAAFLYLCEHGHVSAARQAINTGIDIDLKDMWNNSPLDLAVMRNHLEVVRLLLNATPKTALGRTRRVDKAMILASRYSEEDVINLLIDHGASVNISGTDGSTQVHELCERNKFVAVKSLLDHGADVNVKNKRGFAPLFCATIIGNTERVDALLKLGADVNVKNENCSTPLHEAAGRGYTKCIHMLIKSEADVNAKNKFGFTPLHRGAVAGHTECVDALVKAGANVNVQNIFGFTPFYKTADGANTERDYESLKEEAVVCVQDKYGFTPLHEAASRGYTECVDLLIRASADVNVQNKYGSTPLHEAANGGYIDCIGLLLKAKADVSAQNDQGCTPLHRAVINGNAGCVGVLAEAGADVNVTNRWASTPLHEAADRGYTKCIDVLMRCGAHVLARNKHGFTPLHRAASRGYAECVASLTTTGVDTNVMSKYGATPLQRAAEGGSTECVSMLIKSGAGVNVQDKSGSSALQKAANRGYSESVEVLIKNGADVNLSDNSSSTALHGAIGRGYTQCVDLLLRAKADVNAQNEKGCSPLHEAAHGGHIECTNMLLKARADVNVQNRTGSTPLHEAADIGDIGCVRALLEAGGNINVQNETCSTPLHVAAAKHHSGCIGALLKAQAKVNLQNETGATPLHLSTMPPLNISGMQQSRAGECSQLLLKSGADPNISNNNGRIPLHYAVYSQPALDAVYEPNKDLCKMMLDYKANVHKQDISGDTPLHLLCRISSTTKIAAPSSTQLAMFHKDLLKSMVKLMIAYGADVNVRNDHGSPALRGWCRELHESN